MLTLGVTRSCSVEGIVYWDPNGESSGVSETPTSPVSV